jgi:SAM-dependent methyltransferase
MNTQQTSPSDSSENLYPDGSFRRDDESDDRLFYVQPRLVVHVDEAAVEAIGSYLGSVLPADGVVLDLMSSWRSHMPADLQLRKLVGLGLNAVEMAENPQLDEGVVHDVNADPALPFEDETFDAAVLTVSVQYMVRPVEVFRQVNRVLREAGNLHVIYSNRMFPAKAVAIWKALGDPQRGRLVTSYFQHSGGWETPEFHDIVTSAPFLDPVYVVSARKARWPDQG